MVETLNTLSEGCAFLIAFEDYSQSRHFTSPKSFENVTKARAMLRRVEGFFEAIEYRWETMTIKTPDELETELEGFLKYGIQPAKKATGKSIS